MCTEAKDFLIHKSHSPAAALHTTCLSMNETKDFEKGFAPITCMITGEVPMQVREANSFSNSLISSIDMHVVCKAAAEECDLWIRMSFGSVHISLVSLKQQFGY